MNTTTPTPEPTSARRWVPIAVLAIVGTALAAGLVWFLGDPPSEVDLSETASVVAGDADTATTGGDIAGSWDVNTSVGEFVIDDAATASFVGFRVDEVLGSIGETTAVGRTPDVAGSLTIVGTTLTSVEVSADLTTVVSDESRREDAIQRALGTDANPTATFVLTEPVELGDDAAGGVVSTTATGDLTINGITHAVSVDVEAQLVDGAILVTGSTDVVFADWDVATPSSPAVVSLDDHGIVEFQLWFTR